ncbi:MAG: dephospho-CoA kinase [Candidatus Latescibacterota bacterium]
MIGPDGPIPAGGQGANLLVGVTGGMGSGKSTLARLLVERGARLVDADRIGHRVLEEPAVAGALQQAFGADVRRADGSVDRPLVGERAFASRQSWETLNRIVRPPLAAALWDAVAHARQAPGIVVVDAPLIFEWGEEGRFDVVVVVEAHEETRIRRARQRLGLSEEAVRRRMRWQVSTTVQRRRADHVVDNNGPPEALSGQAETLWCALVERGRGTEVGQ